MFLKLLHLKHFYRALFALLVVLLASSLSASMVLAQEKKDDSFSFKKLLMPGPVIEGHAEYEKQCDLCHGDDRPQLCRDCHEEIDEDIKQAMGFHGTISPEKKPDCFSCHTDHIGRDGDILNFDADTFNHDNTDYHLTGKHQAVACTSCHEAGKKFREAPQACFDCHEKDDHHKGAFGQECSDCHSTDGWKKENKFDHSETDFQLLGKHEEVQCSACHPDQKYEDTPKACVSCHAVSDVHNGINGRECDKCHKETSWEELTFDHDIDTDFKLRGGHTKINCNACHTKPVYEEKTSMICVDCHIKDDKHFGRNGKECESCHSVNGWSKQKFDHNVDTEFELHGKHDGLSCESCHHADHETKKISTACVDCHKDDEPHEGTLGTQCQNCHSDTGFAESLRFDHNITSFPLVGMHAVTSCDSCHISRAFKEVEPQCYSCHKDDDSHNKALGPDCGQCHTPNDWKIWVFDHNTQTNFDLDGSHKGLECNACHTKPTNKKVEQSSACIACHAKDDAHNRRFGRNCEQCHVTESFQDIRMQ